MNSQTTKFTSADGQFPVRLRTSRLWRLSLIVPALLLVLSFNQPARATGWQLFVVNVFPSAEGNITIRFVSCVSDPVSPCGMPVPDGCQNPICAITVSCQQVDQSAMAAAIVNAVNSAGCPGHSAIYEGKEVFDLFFPDGECMCISDSFSADAFPLSDPCNSQGVCEGAWRFDFVGCAFAPQGSCIELNQFAPSALTIDFDSFTSGLVLTTEIPGLLFENTQVNASALAVSPPNRIIGTSPDPLRVHFDPPAIAVGCNIDSDGHTSERQPQIRAFGPGDDIKICDFGQGSDFVGIRLSECRRIKMIELGGVALSGCAWHSSDGFDNLTYEPTICGDIDEDQDADLADARFSSTFCCAWIPLCAMWRQPTSTSMARPTGWMCSLSWIA